MYLCIKGDAGTPQRFWVCVVTNSTEELTRLCAKGYTKRKATDSEISRIKSDQMVYSLGKIADHFFQ